MAGLDSSAARSLLGMLHIRYGTGSTVFLERASTPDPLLKSGPRGEHFSAAGSAVVGRQSHCLLLKRQPITITTGQAASQSAGQAASQSAEQAASQSAEQAASQVT